MLIIPLIILVISIDGLTTNNSPANRLILTTSCQIKDDRLDSIRFIPSVHEHNFYFSNQSSSSSFLLSPPLSYCEHQQTTYYLSSGFAILHSSPRFLVTHAVNSQQTSSVHHYNAILSVVDQSLSSTLATLMSSNENNLLVDSDYNNSTKPTTSSFHSLLSTTTTTFSNVSLIHTTQRGTNRTFNIALLIGCISASIILIIIIIYAFVKYRNRDEGSYKIDESKNFVNNTHINNHDNAGCGGKISSSNQHRQKLLTTTEPNGVDSREWYV